MSKLFLILIFAFLISCQPEGYYTINIVNNSEISISVYGEYILPDTSIRHNQPYLEVIPSGKVGSLYDTDVHDEEFDRLKREKLSIFIFNTDTLEKYDWEIIREEYKILKRYEVNNEDLLKNSNLVTYP